MLIPKMMQVSKEIRQQTCYVFLENTIAAIDIKQCEKSLNLFIYSNIGWEDEFNKGLSAKQRKVQRLPWHLSRTFRVENIVNTKQTIEAKD
ncbi:hypothetical protein OH492_11075 [Vibrio chagasii]|nr:hypothetical protein [Vibrio chagasii]